MIADSAEVEQGDEAAADSFKRRSQGATGEALRSFLERVPDRGSDLEEQQS